MASTIINAARFASTHAAPLSAGKHKIVVVGGGSAGIAVANQLYNKFKSDGQELAKGDIAIIDGARLHHFQPGWTLVGAGLKNKQQFAQPLDSLIPSHLAHIPYNAKSFNPSSQSLELEGGAGTIKYDYLVMAAGLQTNFSAVKNLSQALSDPLSSRVSTIYSYDTCDATYQLIDGLKEGKAIFTQPFGPVKCAGAPQKVVYLADDRWRKSGRGESVKSEFVTGMPTMFGVPHYSKALDALRQSRGIDATFNANLTSIDVANRVATFSNPTNPSAPAIEKPYDILHVTPPMGPLEAIKKSPLADGAGWVDVDQATLQHKKFENVFALGDCSSLPTSKTAAAITAQTPVVVENLSRLIETGKIGGAKYDGYTSCPLLVGNNQVMLAEFKYGGIPSESFGALWDQRKPNRVFYHFVKDVFPYAYDKFMLRGNWYGPRALSPPQYIPSVVPS